MKKSTLVAVLSILAALAGALAAGYLYLVKRERELDEYENMLFSEDFSHEDESVSVPLDEEDADDDESNCLSF